MYLDSLKHLLKIMNAMLHAPRKSQTDYNLLLSAIFSFGVCVQPNVSVLLVKRVHHLLTEGPIYSLIYGGDVWFMVLARRLMFLV